MFENIIDESRGKDFNLKEKEVLFTSNSKKSYKKINKGNKYCSYCKLTSYNSNSYYFLHPSKAPKSWNNNKVTKPKKKENKSPSKKEIRE